MAKQIVLFNVPTSMMGNNMDLADFQSMFDEQLGEDYYVLALPDANSRLTSIGIKVFYDKDFTDIDHRALLNKIENTLEELKKNSTNVKETISY